jgi:hypothetical protein
MPDDCLHRVLIGAPLQKISAGCCVCHVHRVVRNEKYPAKFIEQNVYDQKYLTTLTVVIYKVRARRLTLSDTFWSVS